MNLKKSIILGVVTCVVLAFAFVIFKVNHLDKPRLKAGQVWVYTFDKDNPYKTPTHDTVYILDAKNGYIKYEEFRHQKTSNDKDTTIDYINTERDFWIYELAENIK